ncbi:MAG: hydrogen gas-evolving membrane-bound hydrogenase subunit E [Lachnospiraceae bacterium]
MSRIRPEYEHREGFSFSRWLDGQKDPYLDRMEIKPEKIERKKPVLTDKEKERERLREKLYAPGENPELKIVSRLYQIFCVIFCLILISVLWITVSFLPPTGEADRPDNNEVSARYIEQGLQETGAVNIVTGMILDYRAFDTLGESHVLFIATITVLILLRVDKHKKDEETDMTIGEETENDRIYEPKNDLILQKVATILVPVILLFGIYVILNGHLSPGGGFSGGAIMGAGLILYLNAFGFEKTERFFTEKTYKRICFFALGFYAVAKSYSFFTGANHLESGIPLGEPGAILSSGLILPLNICVGLVVACTMYTFYVMFRKGGF